MGMRKGGGGGGGRVQKREKGRERKGMRKVRRYI